MICFVILAGYLIIYNIFSISIKTDIRAYGLLKNVGTTGKQLKRIVRMQAWYLSAAGIPAGLVLGFGASVLMAPSLTASAEISSSAAETSETVVSAHPLIFLAAGAFTLLTVYLSSIQACRMVERVSPVEALRLAEGEQTGRKIKRNTSVSWWGMAAGNMQRNWKKGLIVMLSVALSMVVVDCIVMMVEGYDFEIYQQTFLAADFQIDQLPGDAGRANFYAVTPEIRKLLDDCPDKEAAGYVYYLPESHEMEPELYQIWENNVNIHEQDWSSYEKELWEKAKSENRINVHLMGVNEAAFSKADKFLLRQDHRQVDTVGIRIIQRKGHQRLPKNPVLLFLLIPAFHGKYIALLVVCLRLFPIDRILHIKIRDYIAAAFKILPGAGLISPLQLSSA